jgi:hypothetical protein
MWSAGQGDNQERFLADLRALRDAAAIGYDELAARAHYPSNILKEAENGPGLPGLPILAAYVRACDADVPEWEERWRRLEYEAQADPGLPVRPAGASPAAVAGARAGVGVAPPDAYDPERIRAALRGGTSDRATRVARNADTARPAAAPRADPDPGHVEIVTPEGPAPWNSRTAGWGDGDTASWPASTGPVSAWDTTPTWSTPVSQDTVPTNGNHHPTYSGSAFDTAVAEGFGPDVTPVSQEDPVPAWLADSEVAAAPEADRLWPEREDTEPAHWSVDGQFAPPVTAEGEPRLAQDSGIGHDAGSVQPAGFAQGAGYAQDAGYAMDTGTVQSAGFAQDAGTVQSAGIAEDAGSVQSAGFAEDAGTLQSAGFAQDAGFAQSAGFAQDGDSVQSAGFAQAAGFAQDGDSVQSAGFAQAAGSAGPAGVTAQAATQPVRSPMAAAPLDQRRRDKFFPLRLAAVMVIAAIIGSVLVLVIR